MTDEKTVRVKYAGNADSNDATAVITFYGDPDRHDINIGEEGDITLEELANLQARGYRLEPVDGSGSSTESDVPETPDVPVPPVPPVLGGGASGSGSGGGGRA